MHVTIDIPEEVAQSLQSNWGANIEGAVLEAIAVEGYRTGALTHGEVGRLLGYESPVQVEVLLRKARVYDTYTEEELEQEFETGRRLLAERDSEIGSR